MISTILISYEVYQLPLVLMYSRIRITGTAITATIIEIIKSSPPVIVDSVDGVDEVVVGIEVVLVVCALVVEVGVSNDARM